MTSEPLHDIRTTKRRFGVELMIYVCELCGGGHEEKLHAEYGLRDNGHCENCTCRTCRAEYGAIPIREYGDDA